jgi:hypothetical protein
VLLELEIIDDAELKEWIQLTISIADLRSHDYTKLIVFRKLKDIEVVKEHWKFIQNKVRTETIVLFGMPVFTVPHDYNSYICLSHS